MKLVIKKDSLLAGLQTVQSVVTSRTTLPILANALLKAEDGRLELVATNLDLCVSCVVEANVEAKGATTVPVKKLYSLVREIESFEIEISSDEKFVTTIKADPSLFKLRGLPPEEFPPVQSFKEEFSFTLPQATLKKMLKRTSYAVSTDETRYVLNGVCFSLKGEQLSLVATDGRRLALVEQNIEVKGGPQQASNYILPSKAVDELSKILSEKGEVKVLLSPNYAGFEVREDSQKSVKIVSKLIDGVYPNFRQVIPQEVKEKARIDREEFLAALKRLEIITSESSNSVKLTFAKNVLTLSVNSPEVGEGAERLAVVYGGQEFSIAFNPRFLIEPLAVLDSEEIEFSFIDELSPGVIKVDEPFIYVVMPMRLNY